MRKQQEPQMMKEQEEDWQTMESCLTFIEKNEEWIGVQWLESSSIEEQRLKCRRQNYSRGMKREVEEDKIWKGRADGRDERLTTDAEVTKKVERGFSLTVESFKNMTVMVEKSSLEENDSSMFGRNNAVGRKEDKEKEKNPIGEEDRGEEERRR